MDRTGTQTDFDNVDTNRSCRHDTPTRPSTCTPKKPRNAPGVSKIRGVEADLTVRPIAQPDAGRVLRLHLHQGAADAEPVPAPAIRCSRCSSVYTPKQRRSGYVDYELPAGIGDGKLRLHLDANYAGRQYSFQTEPVKTDSSFIVNGRIALADIPR